MALPLTILCVMTACHDATPASPPPLSSASQSLPLRAAQHARGDGTPRASQAADTPWTALRGKRVVLLTHPQPHVLRAAQTLLEKRLLSTPDLFVLGIYHASERESYAASRRLLARRGLPKAARMGIRALKCKISAANIWRTNGCSETFRRLFEQSAGIIFTGGADMPPALYGAPTRLTTVIRTPRRHVWELSMLAHLLGSSRAPGLRPLLESRRDYPITTICLGMQSMNVATGGTLYQDIPSELYGRANIEAVRAQPAAQLHRNPHFFLQPAKGVSPFVMHEIKLRRDALWGESSGRRVIVASAHHQAVNKIGKGLEVIATSLDGKVIEAMRHVRYPRVLGIQFHPEYSFVWKPSIEARLHRGHPQKNYFTAALDKAPASRRFHRRIWHLVSNWLHAQKANAVIARASTKSPQGL